MRRIPLSQPQKRRIAFTLCAIKLEIFRKILNRNGASVPPQRKEIFVMTIKGFVKNIMPYGLVKYYYLKKEGVVSSLNRLKYTGYKPAGGYGDKLLTYVQYVKQDTKINVHNVFEIGANFAQDADFLMECFKLMSDNIYVFEAHPEIFKAIQKIHLFHAYNNAVYNEEKEMTFNILPLNYKDTGWSSIHGGNDADRKAIKIQAIRMDNFMRNNNINKIDFVKLDVEGCSYEVLQGFGDRLKDVNCIQVEAEHGIDQFPKDWILYDKIEELLKGNDFELIEFNRGNKMRQSDSFWVQRNMVKYG
jgi:FkbM family methyltransferase